MEATRPVPFLETLGTTTLGGSIPCYMHFAGAYQEEGKGISQMGSKRLLTENYLCMSEGQSLREGLEEIDIRYMVCGLAMTEIRLYNTQWNREKI